MLYEVKGDIVNDTQYTIFCHQVNCQGVMGAGLAKQIRERYPSVYEDYMREIKSGSFLLGSKIYTMTADNRVCISMFAQDGYGKYMCYTNYAAFQTILDDIECELNMLYSDQINLPPIAFPYKIGCGLAGGNWDIIYRMIQKFSERVPNDVYIVSI